MALRVFGLVTEPTPAGFGGGLKSPQTLLLACQKKACNSQDQRIAAGCMLNRRRAPQMEIRAEVAPKPLPSAAAAGTGRLDSLDALRGFDMFWIIGGGAMVEGVWPEYSNGYLPLRLRPQFRRSRYFQPRPRAVEPHLSAGSRQFADSQRAV